MVEKNQKSRKRKLIRFTVEELNGRIEKSEKDFEKGRYIGARELLKKYPGSNDSESNLI